MQTVHKILLGNTIFIILIVLVAILAITTIYSLAYTFDAHAVPYPFDRTFITMPTIYQRSLANPTFLADFNQDGIVDTIYQKQSPASTTRIWGDQFGVSALTTDSTFALTNILAIKQNRLLAMNYPLDSGNTCLSSTSQYNLTTGATIQKMSTGSTVLTVVQSGMGLISNTNKTIYVYRCTATLGHVLTGCTGLNQTSAATLGNIVGSNPLHLSTSALMTWTPSCIKYSNDTASITSAIPSLTSTNRYSTTSSFPAAASIHDKKIQFYANGVIFPTTNVLTDTTLQSTLLLPLTTQINPNIIMNIQLEYTNANFALSNLRFLMKNSTTTYLATIAGTTLFFTPLQDLINQLDGNRVYSVYINEPAQTYPTLKITQTLPTGETGFQFIKPDLTVGSAAMNSPYALYPSGYGLKASSTLLRSYFTEYSNNNFGSLSNYTALQTNIATHQALTLEIKNAFPDTAVRLRDPTMYLSSSSFIWLIDALQTDNTITISLPANQCVYVDIKDISNNDTQWINIGIMCNNGLTYKIIPNTSDLSFQFWTFPYGVNHIFNNTDNILQTQVRHNTVPYIYVLKLIDKNDNVVYDQIINSSISVNLQSVNATNYTKPIFLTVLDYENANNTLYHATLGFPSYLSSINLFLDQYLTKDGFSLVMLMPLIFAAMFTRNTVGIGTILTVVFIATMSWMGVIPIPDLILYAMFIFAAIGLIAYKTAGY